jgi:hypothetical protein
VQSCDCEYAYCDDVDHKCNIYNASLLRASGDHGAVQVLEPLGFDDAVPHGVQVFGFGSDDVGHPVAVQVLEPPGFDDAVPHGVQVFGSIGSDDVGHPFTGGLSTSPL